VDKINKPYHSIPSHNLGSTLEIQFVVFRVMPYVEDDYQNFHENSCLHLQGRTK
jgi:hypothetical protein